MKSHLLILALVASFSFLGSCKKQCDCNPPQQYQLDGTWHMTRVSGGLMGTDLSYNAGEVIWQFQEFNATLIVTNNLDSTDIKSSFARFKTGTYNYATSFANGVNTLHVDGQTVGVYSFGSNKLILDEGVATDGLLMEFER